MLPGEGFAEEEIDVRKRIRMGNMLPGGGFARVKVLQSGVSKRGIWGMRRAETEDI